MNISANFLEYCPLTVTYISNIQIGLYVPNWFTMHNILSRMFTLYIKVVA